jgi:hypothetical protein
MGHLKIQVWTEGNNNDDSWDCHGSIRTKRELTKQTLS